MGKGKLKPLGTSTIRLRKQTIVRLRLLRPYVRLEGWIQSDEKILNKIIDFYIEKNKISEKGLSHENTN